MGNKLIFCSISGDFHDMLLRSSSILRTSGICFEKLLVVEAFEGSFDGNL